MKNMQAFMVVTGDIHPVEQFTAAFANRFTGLDVEFVDGGKNWQRAKLGIGANCTEPCVVMDADLLFRRPWDFSAALELAGKGTFQAVLAKYQNAKAVVAAGLHGRFLNTGLMVIGPDHRPVFARAIEFYESPTVPFFADEGPLNLALREFGTPIEHLPPALNVQVGNTGESDDDDVARHYVGMTWAQKARRITAEAEVLQRGLRPSASGPTRG